MREIKFRAWGKNSKEYLGDSSQGFNMEELSRLAGQFKNWELEQYTCLKDKNGKEIYENCELDGRYRVEYIAPKFVGKDMVKGDIIELYDNKFTITKEHCEISQNSERGTN